MRNTTLVKTVFPVAEIDKETRSSKGSKGKLAARELRREEREGKEDGKMEDKEDFCLVKKKKKRPEREQRAVTWSHNGRRTVTGIVMVPYRPCHGVTPDNTNTMSRIRTSSVLCLHN